MGDKSMLQELIKDFPEDIRLKLRENLDRTRIQNPNDPIYELMIVLGVWAQYYQSIPASIKAAGESVGVQNRGILESFDKRVELLRSLAQNIQAAVDQLEGAPKAIVDQFPIESLARTVAKKIDERFAKLPVTMLELELQSLAKAMESVVGRHGQGGLTQKIETELTSLRKCVESMEKKEVIPDRWQRDMLFGLAGALLTCVVVLLFMCFYSKPVPSIEPDMSKVDEMSRLLRKDLFISQYVTAGVNDQNERGMVVPANRIKSAQKETDGSIKIIFN